MSGPANASINGDGFRFYRWDPATGDEPTDVLSVTSIRHLTGEPFNLVNWKLANLLDVVFSTVKRTVVGPRGGIKEVRKVEEWPGEFLTRLIASNGVQSEVDLLRKWVREQADEPRNVPAIRGTMVHEAIEKNVAWDRVERPYVESLFANLSQKDRAGAKKGVQDEDVYFVRNSVRQYWDMRNKVPFVIIAREPQVWNLTSGYAGSADSLIWFLPDGASAKDVPRSNQITLKLIESIGGTTAVGDWKTSKDVYTDHVVQVHAYGHGEFIGSDGIVDTRLTDILLSTTQGVLFHVRPNKWEVDRFNFQEDILTAFLGSCAFARLLARYPRPEPLFIQSLSGESTEIDE